MTLEKLPSPRLMIRTKENVLSGPFSKEEVIHRILNGQLREADEICPGNGYWIFLHERNESLALLGAQLPRRADFHEERTETGTETVTATKPVSAGDRIDGLDAHEALLRGESLDSGIRKKGRPESLGAVKLVLWGILILVGFILFQVFRITNGF